MKIESRRLKVVKAHQILFTSFAAFSFSCVTTLSPQSALAETTAAATPPATIPTSAAGNAAGQASSSQGMQLLSMGISVGTGYMFAKQCGPHNYLACAMAVASFAQAGMLASSARGAGTAAGYMSTGAYTGADLSGLYGTGTGSTYSDGTGSTSYDPSCPSCSSKTASGGSYSGPALTKLMTDYQKLGENLKNAGLSVDGNNIKLPNGKTVSMNALSSEQSMKDAGFSDSEIQDARATAAKAAAAAKEKYKAIAMAAEGGGGGKGAGANGAGAGAGGAGFSMSDLLKKAGHGADRKAASVSGMSKKFGNDNIGVSGDDIFQMITRRYKARDASNQFLKD